MHFKSIWGAGRGQSENYKKGSQWSDGEKGGKRGTPSDSQKILSRLRHQSAPLMGDAGRSTKKTKKPQHTPKKKTKNKKQNNKKKQKKKKNQQNTEGGNKYPMCPDQRRPEGKRHWDRG